MRVSGPQGSLGVAGTPYVFVGVTEVLAPLVPPAAAPPATLEVPIAAAAKEAISKPEAVAATGINKKEERISATLGV